MYHQNSLPRRAEYKTSGTAETLVAYRLQALSLHELIFTSFHRNRIWLNTGRAWFLVESVEQKHDGDERGLSLRVTRHIRGRRAALDGKTRRRLSYAATVLWAPRRRSPSGPCTAGA